MIRCPVDEQVPIPTPNSTHHDIYERARAACAAAGLLMENGYVEPQVDIEATGYNIKKKLLKLHNDNDVDFSDESSTATGALMVRSILEDYLSPIVREAQDLRNYVTNKLIIESDNADPKVRIKALELLGKIKGVDLFTEHSEVTVHNKSDSELVSVLKAKLSKLANVSDAVVIEPPPKPVKSIDVDL